MGQAVQGNSAEEGGGEEEEGGGEEEEEGGEGREEEGSPVVVGRFGSSQSC